MPSALIGLGPPKVGMSHNVSGHGLRPWGVTGNRRLGVSLCSVPELGSSSRVSGKWPRAGQLAKG